MKFKQFIKHMRVFKIFTYKMPDQVISLFHEYQKQGYKGSIEFDCKTSTWSGHVYKELPLGGCLSG